MTRMLAAFLLALMAGSAAAQFPATPGPAIPTPMPVGDASEGEAASRKCQACRDFAEGGANKIGPPMFGIVGKPAASVPGFAYSQVLMDMRDAGLTWEPGPLAAYLADPRAFAPGTKMNFAGIRNEGELANLVAYLVSLSPGYTTDGAPTRAPTPPPPQPPAMRSR